MRTQEGDVDPELTELTSRAATTVVTLLATDAAPQFTTITMQATTFDDSRMNQAGHHLHVTER